MSISAQSISPQEGVSWKTADSEVIDIELPASTVPNVTLLKAKTVVDVVGEAKMASVNWQQLSGKTRAVMLLQLHSLIEAHANELIDLIVQESGRNIQEAMFDITKGLELIEWATCLSHGSPGKQLEITSGVFCQEARRPLGIVAVITPRCNLGTLPMLTIPAALALGNCVIYKPSEKAPLTAQKLMDLMLSAGFPAGVIQIVHGSKYEVDALCDHPAVGAVTFVGSSAVAEHVANRCQAAGKRVCALGGAKNHAVALPDCDISLAARDIVASFTACAGQRCFATSVLLLAGDGSKEVRDAFTDTLVKEIVTLAKLLTSGQKKAQIGPLACAVDKERVLEYINEAEAQGCQILLDGRSWATEHPAGFWVGPTIILHSNVEDRAMQEEIFGPVLSVYHASSWDEAIAIENGSAYGVAATVYTEKGAHADWFSTRFRAATIGINDAFSVSREPIIFDGLVGSRSKFGNHDLAGESVVDFFSSKVRVTSRWATVLSPHGEALSADKTVSSPLTVANLERQREHRSLGLSPTITRKTASPRSPEFTLPRGNSGGGTPKEGMLRRDSSITIKEMFSRNSSTNSNFTATTDGADGGGNGDDCAETIPKPATFHGIAATSPFASSDPQFDFDLERLQKREDSFQPCMSTQPSFDHDAQREFGCEFLSRRENSDMSALSGITDDLSQRNAKMYFNVDLFAVDSLVPAQIEAFDTVADRVTPHEGQMAYRNSAVRFLRKHLRKALQCNILETGQHAIKCFLPTDPILLSVVLSGKLEPHWQTLVRDGLTRAANAPANGDADAGTAVTDGKHAIRRVEVVRTPNTVTDIKVTCTCDATEVEVSLNSKNDVYMLAFFEEVNTLVGNSGLFKRALLLIRAWWQYETSDYVDSTTKQQIDDSCLTVMVCAIFNQYHARISSPLQALCLFLAEYSAYDGATHAITLQGIVPFKFPEGAADTVPLEPTKRHLISKQIIEKYWQLFNIDEVVRAKNLVDNVSPPLSMDPPVVFLRDAFNVLHPFQTQNMVRTSAQTERKAGRLARAFSDGAKALSLALSKTTSEPDVSTMEVLQCVFPVTLARFSAPSRPDAFGNSIVDSADELAIAIFAKESMSVSLDKLWQSIMYCNFIIKSIVSESAILTYCIDMLSMLGLLTADDLGKRLNEATKVPQLMVALKEQVGGLKEFLKRYPEVFVFSYEHPYNPHIFLRIALAPELQAEIENGILPVSFLSQIIAKFGRIAPPPPKVDSPALRRGKMMTSAPISGPALAMSAGSALDGKVVFGHERSAGGANTLLLMQSDLDLVNVNVSESSPTVSTVSPAHSEQQQQQDRDGAGLDRLSLKNVHLGAPSTVPSFINPYAAPFVSQQQQPQHLPSAPQQQLSPWSSHGANDKNIPIRRPSGTLVNNQSASFNSSSPLTGPQSSSFYQDLGLMSSSILSNSVSMGMSGGLSAPSTGSLAFSSTSSSRSHSMKFHESDLPEGFLDPNSDFFGDPLSSLTGGDARSGNNNDHIDLLSSLRENSKELRDDSSSAAEEYPLSLSSASHSLSGGVASLASRNAPAQQYPPNNRSRYQQHGQQPPQQYGDGYPDYEYDTSLPNLDPYHQAASNNQVKLRSQTYPSQQPQHQPQQPHMGMGMGGGMGLGLEDYGGHEGAYQQAGYSYHNDGGLHSNVHGGGGGQYGQQQPTSPVYGASSGRAPMVRSHSRNMLLQSQQQQVQGMQQQPKFQHKRYDVAQQFKK